MEKLCKNELRFTALPELKLASLFRYREQSVILRTDFARKRGKCAQSAGKRGRERERRNSSVEEEISIINLMKLDSFVHETTHSLHADWFLYDGSGERFKERSEMGALEKLWKRANATRIRERKNKRTKIRFVALKKIVTSTSSQLRNS